MILKFLSVDDMTADGARVLTSPLPKRDAGLANGKTLWGYVEARIDEIVDRFGDISFLVSTVYVDSSVLRTFIVLRSLGTIVR